MISTRRLAVALFVLALVVAGVISFYASPSPDGLNRMAGDLGATWVLGCLVVLALSSLLLVRRSQDPEPIPVRFRARHRHEGE